MYTQKQYDDAYERFKDADDQALRCIKSAFHMRCNLSDEAQAKLAAAIQLQKERAIDKRRSYQGAYRARLAARKS